MKRILPLLLFLLLLTGCGGNAADGAYRQITQEEAKEMMDNQEVIILDVREQDEYDGGHIPGAVLLPVGTIGEDTAAEVIPEKDSSVLVYCRSGNRSKTASPNVVSCAMGTLSVVALVSSARASARRLPVSLKRLLSPTEISPGASKFMISSTQLSPLFLALYRYI